MRHSIYCVCSIIPVYKKCAFFCSFEGIYNDNPKRISEVLHQENPNIAIYWAISDKCREEIPTYIHKIPYGSPFCWVLATCSRVVVDNYFGMPRYMAKMGSITAYVQKLFCRKRKGRLGISTWHGTPLKRIEIDLVPEKDKMNFFSCSDYLIAGCDYTRKCLSSASKDVIPIKMYGTPRNDIFFNKDINVMEVRKKLGLETEKKVVLYAPTFRDEIRFSGQEQMEEIDIEELLRAINKRMNGEFILVLRVHHVVLKSLNNKKLFEKFEGILVDGNLYDDMAEYLSCTDVLITDYSGSMFDFALTKKPCFLFSPDRDHYEKIERGFYMDYDTLPFPKAYNFGDLIKQIEEFDEQDYVSKVEKFLEEIGNVEDGHSAERIVEDINCFWNTGKK